MKKLPNSHTKTRILKCAEYARWIVVKKIIKNTYFVYYMKP